MTYFHTGICTIIGAKSFHGPVRDGKGWDRLAMVVRHNGVLCWRLGQDSEFIESYYQRVFDCVCRVFNILLNTSRTFLMQWYVLWR